MKCPRCGAENSNDARYCIQCGLSRNPEPKTMMYNPNLDYNMPMKFHTFYSVWTLIVSLLMLLFSIISFFVEDGATAGTIALLPTAYYLSMSILLLNRKKAGNIMRLIVNIWELSRAVLLFIATLFISVLFTFAGIISVAEYGMEDLWLIAVVIIIIIVLLFAIAITNALLHGIMIYYYNKRKHMFN